MSFWKKLFGSRHTQVETTSTTKFPGVVIGKVLSVQPHPNADRLRVALVNVGETLQIVCGAPNLAEGQLVPVATVGTTLPNGATITKATLRGVESNGMICAADELGINDDHSGIMVLTKGEIGHAIDSYIS